MNSGRDSFHGSWSWLSSFPSFFGFIPSSRAICTCSCDRRNLRRASIQGCKFAGIRGSFFATDTSAHADRFSLLPAVRVTRNVEYHPVRVSNSLRFDFRGPDHLTPHLDFDLDPFSEFLRCASDQVVAELPQSRLHVWQRDDLDDLPIKQTDDVLRGSGRDENAHPAIALDLPVARLSHGRYIGQNLRTSFARDPDRPHITFFHLPTARRRSTASDLT